MKRLLEGQQLQRTVPPTAGRVEPVVHLPGGLTLDDRSCWQYPTMLVGNVGSGKSTLMEQIRRPVLAHADRVQDTVVIFAAKPDVLRCRRPGDPVISGSRPPTLPAAGTFSGSWMPPIRRNLPCVKSPVLCLPNRRKRLPRSSSRRQRRRSSTRRHASCGISAAPTTSRSPTQS